jgi:hypothetical protein
VIAVGGCATAAQQQAAQMKANYMQGMTATDACWAQAAESQDGRELAELLPPRGNKTPSMTLLTNKQVPSPEQAAVLIRYHNEYRRRCQETAMAALQTTHPALAALGSEVVAVLNQGYAKLASREVSWGAHAQFSEQVNAEAEKQWVTVTQRIRSGLEAQHSAEMRQRQAAIANAYNVYATQTLLNQNQQMINAYNRPRSTNCSVIGGYLNCTTY